MEKYEFRQREDMGVCVSVHDNGSGIDAQTLERICRNWMGNINGAM